MAKGIIKNKRALSPVIATVILVSVTIVVAVAVAYWMGGIAGLYTRFEKLEITSIYASREANGNYTVHVTVKNSGSEQASITDIFLNAKPIADYGTGNVTVNTALPLTIQVGTSTSFEININQIIFEEPSGLDINLKFHSATGKDYPAMVELP